MQKLAWLSLLSSSATLGFKGKTDCQKARFQNIMAKLSGGRGGGDVYNVQRLERYLLTIKHNGQWINTTCNYNWRYFPSQFGTPLLKVMLIWDFKNEKVIIWWTSLPQTNTDILRQHVHVHTALLNSSFWQWYSGGQFPHPCLPDDR